MRGASASTSSAGRPSPFPAEPLVAAAALPSGDGIAFPLTTAAGRGTLAALLGGEALVVAHDAKRLHLAADAARNRPPGAFLRCHARELRRRAGPSRARPFGRRPRPSRPSAGSGSVAQGRRGERGGLLSRDPLQRRRSRLSLPSGTPSARSCDGAGETARRGAGAEEGPRGDRAPARPRPRADGDRRDRRRPGDARRIVGGIRTAAPGAGDEDPRGGRRGLQHRLAAAARPDPLREARVSVAEENRQDEGLRNRLGRPCGSGRSRNRTGSRSRPRMARAIEAEGDVRRRAPRIRRKGRADPHPVRPGGRGDRAPFVERPESPEHPREDGGGAEHPPRLRRAAGSPPRHGGLLADRAPDPGAPLRRRGACWKSSAAARTSTGRRRRRCSASRPAR